MAAIAFANPFGWAALWQPFDYALHLSREPLFRGIGELQPVTPSTGWRYGLWLMVLGWPLLMLLRARRHGLDKVEGITAALVTAYALPSQRFLGVYALVAAPYLARDLETWIHERRWPRWTRPTGARAGLVALTCVAISIPEWTRPLLRPGVGVEMDRFPVAACDWIERHGVRGRGFEHFRFVGYQAWRFWPDRGRLPFMDIHQSGTPENRAAFAAAFTDPGSWDEIARRYRLDYALLDRRQRSGRELLDVIDADSTWALVFVDDVAALYLDRSTLGLAADTLAFRVLGGGASRLATLAAHADDPALQAPLRTDLERAVRESRQNATAHFLLASLDLAGERLPAARAHLLAALAVDPTLPQAHERLGLIALHEKRPQEAIDELERERAQNPATPGIDVGLGMAYLQLGAWEQARRSFESALAKDPGNAIARAWIDSLARARPR
jgi:Flp pilus assembly protein TadD